MANSFVKNVTTAGTQVRLSTTSILVSSVTIRAKKGNTNDVQSIKIRHEWATTIADYRPLQGNVVS